jgi:hypothetical protein
MFVRIYPYFPFLPVSASISTIGPRALHGSLRSATTFRKSAPRVLLPSSPTLATAPARILDLPRRLYQRVVDNLDTLVGAVGLKAA